MTIINKISVVTKAILIKSPESAMYIKKCRTKYSTLQDARFIFSATKRNDHVKQLLVF